MARIFTKTIFSTFLIILIFVNLAFTFNQLAYVTGGIGAFGNYTNRYFGFNTLYEFFTGGFVEDSSLLSGFFSFIQEYLSKLQYALYGSWQELFLKPSGNGFLDALVGIGNTLMSIFSIFGFIFYAILYIVYCLCVACWIILKFMSLLTGAWWSPVPPNPYDNLVHLLLLCV